MIYKTIQKASRLLSDNIFFESDVNMENYNMDLSKKVTINTTKEPFISSPAGGVN